MNKFFVWACEEKINSTQQYGLLKDRWGQSEIKADDDAIILKTDTGSLSSRNLCSIGVNKTKTKTDRFLFLSFFAPHLCVSQCNSALYSFFYSLTSSVIPVNPSRQHGREEFTPKHCQCQQSLTNRDRPGWTF